MRLALLALVALLAAPTAHAAEPARTATPSARPRRVALFPVEGDARLGSRLIAELVSQGFQLTRVDAPPPTDPAFDGLRIAMQPAGADLALRIMVEPARLRLWIINAVTGKQLYREVAFSGSGPDSAIVSLWAVEALRASELPSLAEAAPRAARAAPAPRVEARAPSPHLYALELAPAVTSSPGGVGASLQVALGARRLLRRQLGLEGLLVAPTLPARLERASGSSAVWRGFAGLGGFLTTGGVAAAPALDVAVGAALLFTHVAGQGKDDFVGRTDTLFSVGPYARAGGSSPLSRHVRLRLDTAAGIAFPRPIVLFDDARVAVWGRPWFLLALGGEVTF
jgi:hypothetical protein